jgi:hypothetical protein
VNTKKPYTRPNLKQLDKDDERREWFYRGNHPLIALACELQNDAPPCNRTCASQEEPEHAPLIEPTLSAKPRSQRHD